MGGELRNRVKPPVEAGSETPEADWNKVSPVKIENRSKDSAVDW